MTPAPSHFTDIDRASLVEQHRSYVRVLALEVARGLPPHIELDELIACGNLGLVEAAERYEPRYGVTFQTFAYYRIKGAIYDGLRKLGPMSRTEYARSRFAARANDILQGATDDEQANPGVVLSVDDEIATTKSFIDALIPVYLLSLEETNLPEIADESESALQKVERQELVGLTRSLIAELPEDERQVVEEIYFKHLTIVEVSNKLGISKSWGSRLHAKTIKHLRSLMEQRGLLDSS
ncbi:MAG TPA: sigma-70 family RNA polymerase sigma factor [Pyrinomonadaceae bacterium]|nr:sigma-70 family RNA polymerase sigma factor [Pyrinomonadaceae bacterium]